VLTYGVPASLLLVVLGIWRHVRHHWPLTYEPTLWTARPAHPVSAAHLTTRARP
jgi:hypothetical protein